MLFFPCLAIAHGEVKDKDRVIVLFPGFLEYASSLDPLKKQLKSAFPSASVIALTSVEGSQSAALSIKEQVAVSFKELEEKVDEIENKSFLFIGSSQGGIRAFVFYTEYNHVLNVKGLVSLASPWEGVPGARVDAAMLSNYLTEEVIKDFHLLARSLGYAKPLLLEQFKEEVERNQACCIYPGAKDLIPGSSLLTEIRQTLPHVEIPILLIGAGQSNFNVLVSPKHKYAFKALNKMYTSLVVGEGHSNRIHDMKIPLYSQHALTIIPGNIKSFRRIFIKDAFHSGLLWNTITLPQQKVMGTHPRVWHNVIKFANRVFAK